MEPISNDSGNTVGFDEIKPVTIQEKKKPTFLETFISDIKNDNTIYNTGSKLSNEFLTLKEWVFEPSKKFNFFDSEYINQVHPDDIPSLATSRSEKEFYRRLEKKQQERHNREISIEGSLSANLGAAFFNIATDPLSWTPVGMGIRAAKVGSAFSSGFKAALPGMFVSSAMSEGNLYWAQETREAKQLVFNTLSQTMLGGLIGGTGNAIRTGNMHVYKKMIESTLEGNKVNFSLDKSGNVDGFNVHDSAGSMSSQKIKLEGEQLVGWNSSKFSPVKPFFWMAGRMAQNPVVKGLISKSPTVAKFTNDLYEHNFDLVKSAIKGEVKQVPLQTKLGKYDRMSSRVDMEIANSYFEYIGLPSNEVLSNTIKSSFKNNKDKMNMEDYLKEFSLALSRGGKSDVSHIAYYSNKIIKDVLAPVYDKAVKIDLLSPNIKPFGADQHIMRVYDKERISAKKPYMIEFVHNKFLETEKKLRIIEEKRASLKGKDLEKYERQLRQGILKGKFSPDMLVGERGMSWDDIQTIRKMRKPLNQAKKELKEVEENLRVHKRKLNHDRKPGQKNVEPDSEQIKLTGEIIKIKEKIKEIKSKINQDIKLDENIKHLAVKDKEGNYRLKKINKGTLAFRKILEPEELLDSARNTIENILGLSEEQMTKNIYDMITSGSNGNPLKNRSLFIMDEDLYKSGMLVNDPRVSIKSYLNKMGRLIEMQEYLKKQDWDGKSQQIEFLTNGIKHDYNLIERKMEARFSKELEGKVGSERDKILSKQSKKRLRLQKSLESDIDVVSDGYKRIMGIQDMSHKKLIRTSRFLNNWAYATQLGALLFTAIPEVVAPIMRAGPLNWAKYGPIPYIKNIVTGNWKNNARLKQSAAELNVNLQLATACHNLKYQKTADYELPMNFIERQAENAAKTMGILNLTNAWADVVGNITSNVIVSRLASDLRKFLNGTLEDNYIKQLAVLGLNDKHWAKRIVALDDEFGETLGGARLPNWLNWDKDLEAKWRFQEAVMQEFRSTIFTGNNIASYPSGLPQNGLASSLLIYMGWMFNATANYTLPLLQRFDANKIMGAMAMWAAAMLQDPLREIADGKEPNLDPEQLVYKGFLNSGVGGLFVDYFNKANAIGEIIPSLVVDKYKGKGFELVAGMPGSLSEAALKLGGMVANREYNKADIKKIARTIPLIKAFEFRKLTNDYIDSLNIPETRQKARKEL